MKGFELYLKKNNKLREDQINGLWGIRTRDRTAINKLFTKMAETRKLKQQKSDDQVILNEKQLKKSVAKNLVRYIKRDDYEEMCCTMQNYDIRATHKPYWLASEPNWDNHTDGEIY